MPFLSLCLFPASHACLLAYPYVDSLVVFPCVVMDVVFRSKEGVTCKLRRKTNFTHQRELSSHTQERKKYIYVAFATPNILFCYK